MTDWAEGIENRNYGIKNRMDVGMLSELLRVILTLVMVAGALLFYSWVRSGIVSTGYESQHLFAEEESLLRTQKSLILEEKTLSDPQRIDTIARNELGMILLRPNQWILPQPQDVERGSHNVIAMVESERAVPRRTAGTGSLTTDRNN